MVLSKYVCQMAYEGDIDAVKAWLAADPSRDVTDLSFWEGETHSTSNHSNLLTFAAAGRPSEAKCVLIRWLLEQGVDPCHYVRACGGSWKSYCRLPHKEVLRLRSLISRGRARPRREPILQNRAAAYRSIVFLCKLGDNGVVWKILEFWQATR